MTDDIVKRAREADWGAIITAGPDAALLAAARDLVPAMADRIEVLEQTLSLADDQRREWERHCKTAESERDALVEAAKWAKSALSGLPMDEVTTAEMDNLIAALATIKEPKP